MVERRVIRYSEAFKRQVLQECDDGRWESFEAARRAYGIGGTWTIQKWAKRAGRERLLGKVVCVMSTQDRDEVKRLKDENRRLKEVLADTHVANLFNQGLLAEACDQFGTTVEALKKKAGSRPSNAASPPARGASGPSA